MRSLPRKTTPKVPFPKRSREMNEQVECVNSKGEYSKKQTFQCVTKCLIWKQALKQNETKTLTFIWTNNLNYQIEMFKRSIEECAFSKERTDCIFSLEFSWFCTTILHFNWRLGKEWRMYDSNNKLLLLLEKRKRTRKVRRHKCLARNKHTKKQHATRCLFFRLLFIYNSICTFLRSS
jgi:hypothetical protein